MENPFTDSTKEGDPGAVQNYLSSLSVFLQESINQSGMKFQSVEEARKFVENINQPK